MYKISDDLKSKIKDLNDLLKEKYEPMLRVSDEDLLDFIRENIGHIKKVEAMPVDKLEKVKKKGGVVGVDGSNNKKGGAYPHYVELYQGLAKSTVYKNKSIKTEDIFTPLLEEKIEKSILENSEEDVSDKEAIRKYKLANVELQAALKSIDELKPYIILMDGSLVRYKIQAKDSWEELRHRCEEEGILLVGVIEDIKTSIISQERAREEGLDESMDFYDRELLFGQLEYGELIRIRKDRTEKTQADLESIFIRSSRDPSVIGLDMLDTQADKLEEIASLILALTPENSRGVPLWLDIVDSEVKITNTIIDELLESYMDRQVLEVLFVPERDKRNF